MNKINCRLPGLNEQYDLLKQTVNSFSGNVLFLGAGTESLVKNISEYEEVESVFQIVENEELMLQIRMKLGNNEKIKVRNMSFDNIDFKDESFSLIYSQGSVSLKNRRAIIKEVKRVVKNNGFFCVGEIVSLTKTIPRFVKDIWDASNLNPMFIEEMEEYYKSFGFIPEIGKDLSYTLKDYYEYYDDTLRKTKTEINEDELRFNKKLINKIKHEINAYLKLGGHRNIGFKTLLLKKVTE